MILDFIQLWKLFVISRSRIKCVFYLILSKNGPQFILEKKKKQGKAEKLLRHLFVRKIPFIAKIMIAILQCRATYTMSMHTTLFSSLFVCLRFTHPNISLVALL